MVHCFIQGNGAIEEQTLGGELGLQLKEASWELRPLPDYCADAGTRVDQGWCSNGAESVVITAEVPRGCERIKAVDMRGLESIGARKNFTIGFIGWCFNHFYTKHFRKKPNAMVLFQESLLYK